MSDTPSQTKTETSLAKKGNRTPAEIRAALKALEEAEKKQKERAREAKEALRRKLDVAEKRDDTRRKILAGSWVLGSLTSDADLRAKFEAALPTYLTRDDDRALFGLEPLAEPAGMRIDLTVPIEEKDAAKALGARWDGKAKVWYVPAGTDSAPLVARWPRAGSGSRDGA